MFQQLCIGMMMKTWHHWCEVINLMLKCWNQKLCEQIWWPCTAKLSRNFDTKALFANPPLYLSHVLPIWWRKTFLETKISLFPQTLNSNHKNRKLQLMSSVTWSVTDWAPLTSTGVNGTNIFDTLYKYSLQVVQILLTICTNAAGVFRDL